LRDGPNPLLKNHRVRERSDRKTLGNGQRPVRGLYLRRAEGTVKGVSRWRNP